MAKAVWMPIPDGVVVCLIGKPKLPVVMYAEHGAVRRHQEEMAVQRLFAPHYPFLELLLDACNVILLGFRKQDLPCRLDVHEPPCLKPSQSYPC